MGDAVLTEAMATAKIEQPVSSGSTENPSGKMEKTELLKRPDLLTKASYLILSLNSLNPQKVSDKLNQLFQSGEVPPEDKAAFEQTREKHEEQYNQWKTNQLQKRHEKFQQAGLLNTETESTDELYCVHCTNYLPTSEDNQAVIQTTSVGSEGETFHTSVHFTLNHTVGAVSGFGKGESWENKDYVILSPLKGVIEQNGSPYGFLPEDTWWGLGVEKGVKLPAGTKLVIRKGDPKITQAKNLAGIEVIEVDGKPHSQAYQVMQEKGIKIISPRQFKGGQKLADQLGSFYGYHLGSVTGEGAESYLRAEAMIESSGDISQTEEVARLVKCINESNDSPFKDWADNVNFNQLTQLLFLDYFGAEDFPEVAFVHPQNGHQVSFEEAVQAMRHHYYSENHQDNLQTNLHNNPDFHNRMVAWVGLNIFNQLLKMAATDNKLSSISQRMLEQRAMTVKNNLNIIPPQLIGALTTSIYNYL